MAKSQISQIVSQEKYEIVRNKRKSRKVSGKSPKVVALDSIKVRTKHTSRFSYFSQGK